nr:MAG: hypothetical protein [Jiangsu forest noda-like virus]
MFEFDTDVEVAVRATVALVRSGWLRGVVTRWAGQCEGLSELLPVAATDALVVSGSSPRPGILRLCGYGIGALTLVAGGVGVYWFWKRYDRFIYADRPEDFGAVLNQLTGDYSIREQEISLQYILPIIWDDRNWDNGHAISGAARDNARRHLESVGLSQGLSLHAISPSAHDKFVDTAQHEHLIPQDMHMPSQNDPVPRKSLIYLIDCDYYLPDFQKLMRWEEPIGFYTFAPTAVAGMDGDSVFTFRGAELSYVVSGGSTWRSKIWDWRGTDDHLGYALNPGSLPGGWCWTLAKPVLYLLGWLGVRYQVVFKKVVQETKLRNRALVWLLPTWSTWVLPFSTRLQIPEPKRLCPMDLNKPGWSKLKWIRKDEDKATLMVNIGRQGEFSSYDYVDEQFSLAMGCQSTGSISALLHTEWSREALAMANQYYAGTAVAIGEEPVLGAPHTTVDPYLPRNALPYEVETNWRAISPALVDFPNAVPETKRFESFEQTIDYRVTRVVNRKVPGRNLADLAKEFVKLVVPVAGRGYPLSIEEVRDEMDKPAQKLAFERVAETLGVVEPRAMIDSFVKNEPTMKPNRVISAFADFRFIVELSRFTIAFRNERLHGEDCKHFFMPGHTPPEIAERLVEYASAVGEPTEGDFSNFDGTVSAWLQTNVINAVYLRWVGATHHEQCRKLLDILVFANARSKRGNLRYYAGPGIKSGSPTTCDGNTVLNAFIQFCAIKRKFPKLDSRVAFSNIGLAFGDDSVFEKQYTKQWIEVVSELGMALKVDDYDPEKGLSFLARVYPLPFDSTTSFQDPLRTMRKLHLTSRNKNVPLADAATDRCEGFLVTDSCTPIISTYCENVIRTYHEDASSLETRRRRGERWRDRPYWCEAEGGSWPQDPHYTYEITAVMANRIGVSVAQLMNYDRYLSVTRLTDIRPLSMGSLLPYEDCFYKDAVCFPVVGNRVIAQLSNNVRSNDASGRVVGAGRPDGPALERGGRVGGGGRTDVREERKDVARLEIHAGDQRIQDPHSDERRVEQTPVQRSAGTEGVGPLTLGGSSAPEGAGQSRKARRRRRAREGLPNDSDESGVDGDQTAREPPRNPGPSRVPPDARAESPTLPILSV